MFREEVAIDLMENKLNDMIIIKSIGATLNEIGTEDIVYLIGKKYEESTVYYEKLGIIVSNGENGKSTTLAIKTGSGYNPKIIICDFDGDKLDEILFTSEQGGSGGYLNVNIYKMKNNELQEIFSSDKFNSENIYTVTYKNNYIVEICDELENKKYSIDIRLKSKDYLNEIYDEKGKVKKNVKGEVLPIGGAYTIDIDNDNICELLIVQRIIGLYNADTLGEINTVIKYTGNDFNIIKKNISTEGISYGCSRCCKDIKNGLMGNRSNIDFTKVNFIESEKIKNYKIERALEKEFNIKSGVDKVTYLYNKIDLNDNKKKEVIVYLEGAKFCRNMGCTVVILEDKGSEYSVISKISESKNPIIISDEKTNGYKNIIMQVENRCGETMYRELKFNGNGYPSTPIDEPRIKKGNKVEGIAVISDDLFYVKGIEF